MRSKLRSAKQSGRQNPSRFHIRRSSYSWCYTYIHFTSKMSTNEKVNLYIFCLTMIRQNERFRASESRRVPLSQVLFSTHYAVISNGQHLTDRKRRVHEVKELATLLTVLHYILSWRLLVYLACRRHGCRQVADYLHRRVARTKTWWCYWQDLTNLTVWAYGRCKEQKGVRSMHTVSVGKEVKL